MLCICGEERMADVISIVVYSPSSLPQIFSSLIPKVMRKLRSSGRAENSSRVRKFSLNDQLSRELRVKSAQAMRRSRTALLCHHTRSSAATGSHIRNGFV